MEVYDLIPKDKHDFSTVEQLEQLDPTDIAKIGMKLLEWLQDFNWPIASGIKPIVIKNQSVLMEDIKTVLCGFDEDWKYFLILKVLPDISEENISMLLPIVKRIALSPTESEIDAEVHIEARDFLEQRQ